METDALGPGGVWIGIVPMENRFDETRIHFVVSLVIADIPPIIEMKNPARSPSVVHSISETARKAAEACDFFI